MNRTLGYIIVVAFSIVGTVLYAAAWKIADRRRQTAMLVSAAGWLVIALTLTIESERVFWAVYAVGTLFICTGGAILMYLTFRRPPPE